MPLWADAVQDVPAFRLDNYSYVVGGGELFTIKAAQQWNNYENSYLKRKVIERIIYPFLRLLPLKKKYVVFEGWWGDRFHCNPRAFYEYLQQYHPDYTCIWALNDVRTDVTGNAKKVRRLSLQYHYYMAVSKYFINNVNFADSYVKRKGQIEIQTMHGTPLKTMGLDVPGELPTQKDVDRFLRRCGRWDYLVVQSHRVETITRSCYAYKKAYLETGYPRNDVLFAKNNADDIRRLKEKIGLPTDKKVIMYAPTWRVRNQFKLNMDQAKLKERLGEDYVLMLRAHPFAASGIDEGMLDDFIYNVSYYPFVEELYLVADLVITDYSSVMFDYAILNRPMLFYVYDLDDYKDTLRGFNFDFIAEAPGPLLRTADEVLDAIESIDEVRAGYEDKMQSFRRNFCEFEHGNACEQIFGTVFMK
jgi:CDP-glycerol glycerophosphotransferase